MWACVIFKKGDVRYIKWTSVNEKQRGMGDICKIPNAEVRSASCPESQLGTHYGTLYIPGTEKSRDNKAVLFPDLTYTRDLIKAMKAAGIKVSGLGAMSIKVNTRRMW